MTPTSEAVRRSRAPAYLVACLMVFVPLVEIAVSAWPYRIHDPAWRVALVTTVAGVSTAILLAILLAYVVGLFSEDRLTIWLVAIMSALIVLLCVGGSGAFVLDALQLRAQVQPGLERRFNLTSGWALGKVILAGIGAAVLSVSAFRSARSMRRAYDRRGKKAPAVLVTSSTAVASAPSSKPADGLTQAVGPGGRSATVTNRGEQ